MAKRSRRRSKPKKSSEQDNGAVDLSEEYSYVLEDLQRIGIIAAILIAGLVALSFFL